MIWYHRRWENADCTRCIFVVFDDHNDNLTIKLNYFYSSGNVWYKSIENWEVGVSTLGAICLLC